MKQMPLVSFAVVDIPSLSRLPNMHQSVRGSPAPAGAHTAADFTTAECIDPITSHAHTTKEPYSKSYFNLKS
jgi:hypothetical protein